MIPLFVPWSIKMILFLDITVFFLKNLLAVVFRRSHGKCSQEWVQGFLSLSAVDIWDNPLSWGCPLPCGCVAGSQALPTRCQEHAPSPPAVAWHYRMVHGVGRGQNYPKVRPLPRRHNHSHGPCLQFFLNDQLSPRPLVSLGPTLHPLHPVGQHSPSILQFFPRQMLSPLFFPPTTCSKFNAHCFCHEIFALYLPNYVL